MYPQNYNSSHGVEEISLVAVPESSTCKPEMILLAKKKKKIEIGNKDTDQIIETAFLQVPTPSTSDTCGEPV